MRAGTDYGRLGGRAMDGGHGGRVGGRVWGRRRLEFERAGKNGNIIENLA
jgi:hypothetical protein